MSMCDEDCGNVVEQEDTTTCDTCLADPRVADYPPMRWPKPKPIEEVDSEDGKTHFLMDMTPHPSIITHHTRATARDYIPEFVDEAVRFFLLMTTINGLSVEDARKLSKPEHYSLHIDEDSDDKAYLLRVVGKEEEE
tara:strand:+ start:847 stop:1257 length:411 start_codon:yes stop_codon:yes gene_type:complete